MSFKSSVMKRAWEIRKRAAVQYGCRCNQISWKECLQMAVAEETTLLLAAPQAQDPLNGIKIEFPFNMKNEERTTLTQYIVDSLKLLSTEAKHPLSGDVLIQFNNGGVWVDPMPIGITHYSVVNRFVTEKEKEEDIYTDTYYAYTIVVSTYRQEGILSMVAYELSRVQQHKDNLWYWGQSHENLILGSSDENPHPAAKKARNFAARVVKSVG